MTEKPKPVRCDPFQLPDEAAVVAARARHRHHLEAASNELFQDREKHRAAGVEWPEELQEAHAAIRRQLAAREAGDPVGELE
jgi:hypothetical protein